jgi:hypothetical protein
MAGALEKDRDHYGSLHRGNEGETGVSGKGRQAHYFLAGGDFVGTGFAAGANSESRSLCSARADKDAQAMRL